MPSGVSDFRECNQCDSKANVKKFTYYDARDPEYLCWTCRRPIIMERLSDDEDETEEEPSGQTGLGDFS